MTRARLFAALAALLLALGAIVPAPATAQEATLQSAVETAPVAPDYDAWNSTATRAEEAIEAGRASNLALEQLRAELVEWRTKFLAAQDVNQTRIKTLRDQIAALGPVPEDGSAEPVDIAARRAELTAQLTKIQAPAVKADEAFTRADGLIREIDGIIRDRQADALLELGPSPLNPSHWHEGAKALLNSLRAIMGESVSAWMNPVYRTQLRQDAPAVLFYLAVALVLLMRGRRWMVMLLQRLNQGAGARGRAVWAGLLSLGQIVLPFVGLLALMLALRSSGLLGLRGGRLAELVPQAGLILFAARWLAGRVFPQGVIARPILALSEEAAARARWSVSGLGLVLALNVIVTAMADFEGYSAAASATLSFPLLLAAGLLMLGLARLMMAHLRAHGAENPEQRSYRDRLVFLIARATMALALLGPVLAAIGYNSAAVYFTYPAVYSLALLGALAVLQRFVYDAYAMLIGDAQAAQDALIPVLLGFVLTLLALPVLALIWGARQAELMELWARFTEGFQLGDTRISPTVFLTFVVIFAAGYTLTRLLQGALRSSVLPKTRIDTGGQNAIVSGTGYLGIFLAALIAITSAGIDLSSLAIVAGALSVGIGFGLQNIVSNFVSGIILLIERPVSEGDWIEVGGVMGIVRNISVRSTTVETFDRTDVIVPNSDLISGMVTNWTRSNLTGRLILPVGVAYGSDTKKVEEVLREVAEGHPLVIINPPPLVLFQGFGADSLDFEIRVILRDINFGLSVRTALNHEIYRRFKEEGIEIPFAQRDVWLRNPEALRSPSEPRLEPLGAALPQSSDRPYMGPEDIDMNEPGDER